MSEYKINLGVFVAKVERIEAGRYHGALGEDTFAALVAIAERLEEIANQVERLNVRKYPAR